MENHITQQTDNLKDYWTNRADCNGEPQTLELDLVEATCLSIEYLRANFSKEAIKTRRDVDRLLDKQHSVG